MMKLHSRYGSHKTILYFKERGICDKYISISPQLKNDEHMMNPNSSRCGSHKTIFKRTRYM